MPAGTDTFAGPAIFPPPRPHYIGDAMDSGRYVDVQVDLIEKETALAFKCRIGDDVHWIPKSQIDHPDDFREGDDEVEIPVARWFVDKEEIAFE